MRAALLIVSLALPFTTVGECFSQEPPQSSQQAAKAVVIKLYRQVVRRKPIGIPREKDRRTIWPLLSQDLIERMRVAKECEKDFFRQYPDPTLKPGFGWLEFGLFSGGDELAGPSLYSVRRAVRQNAGSFQVEVQLTYKDTFAPVPKDTFKWDVIAFVTWDGHRFAIDDILYSKDYPEDPEFRLSQLLSQQCKDGKFVIMLPDN
jgi:hypothetical protein